MKLKLHKATHLEQNIAIDGKMTTVRLHTEATLRRIVPQIIVLQFFRTRPERFQFLTKQKKVIENYVTNQHQVTEIATVFQ